MFNHCKIHATLQYRNMLKIVTKEHFVVCWYIWFSCTGFFLVWGMVHNQIYFCHTKCSAALLDRCDDLLVAADTRKAEQAPRVMWYVITEALTNFTSIIIKS